MQGAQEIFERKTSDKVLTNMNIIFIEIFSLILTFAMNIAPPVHIRPWLRGLKYLVWLTVTICLLKAIKFGFLSFWRKLLVSLSRGLGSGISISGFSDLLDGVVAKARIQCQSFTVW